MWQFILGFVVGTNVGIFLYACIIIGKKNGTENE